MLNKSKDNEYPYLVPENAFSFLTVRIILAIGFLERDRCYYLEKDSFHAYFAEGFIHEWVWDLVSNNMIIMIFIFPFTYVMYNVNCFLY